jgi:hypothetical protein
VIALEAHLDLKVKEDLVVIVMDTVEVKEDLVVNLEERREELQLTIDLPLGVLEEDLVLVVVLEHQLAQMMLKCNAFLLQLMQFWMLLDSIVFPLHQMLFDPSDILFNIRLFMQ